MQTGEFDAAPQSTPNALPRVDPAGDPCPECAIIDDCTLCEAYCTLEAAVDKVAIRRVPFGRYCKLCKGCYRESRAQHEASSVHALRIPVVCDCGRIVPRHALRYHQLKCCPIYFRFMCLCADCMNQAHSDWTLIEGCGREYSPPEETCALHDSRDDKFFPHAESGRNCARDR